MGSQLIVFAILVAYIFTGSLIVYGKKTIESFFYVSTGLVAILILSVIFMIITRDKSGADCYMINGFNYCRE